MEMGMEVEYFASGAAFRAWLEREHDAASEILLGFYKKDTGRAGLTYAEALDAALCFGWIDGVRRRVDDACYSIRFTPRKPGSIWSAVNIARVGELEAQGLMQPAGLAAFQRRAEHKSKIYAYENPAGTLDPAEDALFRAHSDAWAFFTSQAPSYQRGAIWWVVSAKQQATRQRRLATLIADSAAARRLAHLTRNPRNP